MSLHRAEPATRRIHPIVYLDYPIRIGACLFLGLILAAALAPYHPAAIVWILLAVHAVVWPHLALLNARLGRNTKNAELTNLLIDAFIGGCWIAAVRFNPWPAAMTVTAHVIAFLSIAGIRFTLIALAVNGAGVVLTGAVFGFAFESSASPLVIWLSIGGFVFYASVFGLATNRQARRIIQSNRTIERQKGELTEALEHQTATSDVARAISRSPTNARPVLQAIAGHVARLCDTIDIAIFLIEGGVLRRVVDYAAFPRSPETEQHGIPIDRRTVSGRAVVERRPVHVADIAAESDEEYELSKRYQAHVTVGSILAVPILREGEPLGVVLLRRQEVRPFADRQIELVQTFADQASIALDNTRLFDEVQARSRDLAQSLDETRALSDVSRVISSSLDLQQVFETVIRHATSVAAADAGAIFEVDTIRRRYVSVVGHNVRPEFLAAIDARHIDMTHETWRRTHESGRPWQIPDLAAVPHFELRDLMVGEGFLSVLAAPIHTETALRGIVLWRRIPGAFEPRIVNLLTAFCEQAKVAIANAALFRAVEEKNRALSNAHAKVTEALDQQTTTAEILRVISRSPTDVQPVLDAIAEGSVRLCNALFGVVYRFDGEYLRFAAHHNVNPDALELFRRALPTQLDARIAPARSILERRVIAVPNVETYDSPLGHALARAVGAHSFMSVPMLKDETSLGAITVGRAEGGPFSDQHIALLRTFADQAVIAIENVRLFKELEARNHDLTSALDRQTATAEILRVISQSQTDLQPVIGAIVKSAVRLCGAGLGALFQVEAGQIFPVASAGESSPELQEAMRQYYPRPLDTTSIIGRAIVEGRVVQVADFDDPATPPRLTRVARAAGFRSQLSVPMLRDGKPIGGISLARREPGAFSDDQVALIQTLADQAVIAIENVRLFTALQQKSRELETASRHKSEFLASMSHELRTPLNAIIGFSDVLLDKMFGEINEKQTEYLQDVLASGKHLLSLINDILDLSKIEAGKMELNLMEFDLAQAVEDALMLMRERAARRGITLDRHVDARLGDIRADERKVKQVLLNLLSNAVKFTPEGGRIRVRAGLAEAMAEISVTDTGIGIALEDQVAIFEEFKQVGAASKKIEGTGLGLALCRKFVELHGGEIWVKSEIGQGSTFTFTIPLRPGRTG